MPYRPGLVYRDGVPVSYDGGDYPLELRRALELLDYDGWRKRQREELRADGRRSASASPAISRRAAASGRRMGHREDRRARASGVLIGVSGSGHHETVFAQVCAEYLGAAFGDIRVRGGDTTLVPYGYGTGASRVAVNTGNAVAEAAAAVAKSKTVRVAAGLLECAPADVRIEESRARSSSAPGTRDPARPAGAGGAARARGWRAGRAEALGHEVLRAPDGHLVERGPRGRRGRRGDRARSDPALRHRPRLRPAASPRDRRRPDRRGLRPGARRRR